MEKKLILPESWWPPGVSYRMPGMCCSRGAARFTPQLGSGISEVNSQMSDSLLMPVHQCPTPRMCLASLLEEAELKAALWVWELDTDSQWVCEVTLELLWNQPWDTHTHLAGECCLGRLLLLGHMICWGSRQPREMGGAWQQIPLDLGCKERTSWKVTPWLVQEGASFCLLLHGVCSLTLLLWLPLGITAAHRSFQHSYGSDKCIQRMGI